MSMLGGEKISRLAVGLFALVLTGGLAAFFGGYLDPFLGTQKEVVVKPPMPFAKPPAAAKPAPALNPASAVTVAPTISTAPAPAPVASSPAVAATLPANVETANKVAVTASPDIGKPIASSTNETQATTKPVKKSAPTQARSRDLDLRHCLDLPTEMEMAQCAYKLP